MVVELPMTDQDKLNLIEKYRNNPVAFVEDMHPDIKLHEYQKVLLNMIHIKDGALSFIGGRILRKEINQ